jgi:hypothetical protein
MVVRKPHDMTDVVVSSAMLVAKMRPPDMHLAATRWEPRAPTQVDGDFEASLLLDRSKSR